MYLSKEVLALLKESFKKPSVYNEYYTKQSEDRLKRWIEIHEKKIDVTVVDVMSEDFGKLIMQKKKDE